MFYSQGNADAATAIGQILSVGAKGLRRDRARAYRYFTQAAAQGDADAMAQLGHMFAAARTLLPQWSHVAMGFCAARVRFTTVLFRGRGEGASTTE